VFKVVFVYVFSEKHQYHPLMDFTNYDYITIDFSCQSQGKGKSMKLLSFMLLNALNYKFKN